MEKPKEQYDIQSEATKLIIKFTNETVASTLIAYADATKIDIHTLVENTMRDMIVTPFIIGRRSAYSSMIDVLDKEK